MSAPLNVIDLLAILPYFICFVVEPDLDLDLGDNAEGGVDEEEISLEPCSSVVVLVEVVLVVLEVDKALKIALSWSRHNQEPARLTWKEKPHVTSHQCLLLILTCSSFVRAAAKCSGVTKVRSSPEMSSRPRLALSCTIARSISAQ